jgi:leucyl-tRNA---protein transferase
MELLGSFETPPHQCGYLPHETAQLRYDLVSVCSPAEYMRRMQRGWRRFGHSFFRPQCPGCSKCEAIRVVVDRFVPNRSQQRCRKRNDRVIQVEIGAPAVTHEKLELYDRYHAFMADLKGWPEHPAKNARDYAESFVFHPFPTQEWCYYLDDRLVGVGYVDDLPGGLSGIYFYYDPDLRHRSVGTWNVLSILDYAKNRHIPHVYLGYYVEGSQSMLYKSLFVPNEVLGADGRWHVFKGGRGQESGVRGQGSGVRGQESAVGE